jgi:thiol-disulfide isomerase/thioredoxin
MSDLQAKPKTRPSTSLIAVALAALVAVAAGIYLIAGSDRKPEAPSVALAAGKITKELATGSLTAFVIKPNRPPVPEIKFTDAAGNAKSINDWRGRVVLINLWATWCAPCRKEMPSLAALQRELGSKDFEVVAISLDRKGAEAAAPFLKEVGAADLTLYLDPSTTSLNQLQAMGLPASVLIDREGREIGRMLGPAEWSSPEALALIRAAIAENS